MVVGGIICLQSVYSNGYKDGYVAGIREKSMKRGYTLVELLIVLAIICIFFSILFVGCASCNGVGADTVQRRANEDARAFLRDLRPDLTDVRVSCQSLDSDGDGYVTCTGSGMAGTARELLSIDCRSSFLTEFQRGCRMTRIPLQGRIQYSQ